MNYTGRLDRCTAVPSRRALTMGTDEWPDSRVPDRGPTRPGGLIQERIEDTAQGRPDAVAIIDGERRVTYRELDRRANGVARALRARGVGPETLVGVCMERSAELVMGMLGVLKAGGAYVPLDPKYPLERLRLIAADAGMKAVLTDDGGWQELATESLTVGEIAEECDELESSEAEPANLAYVIYTSGSTGRPKGVALEHRQAWAFLEWAQATYDEDELRTVLAGTSVCFDLSVFEVFAPLWKGTTVVMAPSVLAIGEVAAEVTLINTVPTALRELVESHSVPRSVRVINVAGEPLSRSLVDLTYEKAPWVQKIYNLYGPTETTTYSTCALMSRGDAGVPTIGRPIQGTEILILDERQQPCAVGTAGELYIGGSGVARGYLKQPDLTAARFVSWPEGTASKRLYRTGDLVRGRADESLEFLGRLDHQVKVRGFRIELGDVEAALLQHPSVREGVLVAFRDEEETATRLVAYVVPRDGAGLASDILRTHLGMLLPDYMVPSAYVILDKLPLTPNGKVDRAKLPAPTCDRDASALAQPRTAEESLLLEIWRDVLRVPEIGIHDHFLDLGGDSLRAAQISARIRSRTGRRLPFNVVLRNPTIERLADRLAATLTREQRAPIAVAPVRHRGDVEPSPSQQRFWFLDQLHPKSSEYNVGVVVEIRGEVLVDALEESLRMLVERHEALRTTLPTVDDGCVQRIASRLAISLPVTEAADPVPDDEQKVVQRIARQELKRPFELGVGPLLRVHLVRKSRASSLVVVLHHAICDGWSLSVLVRDLAALYDAAVGAGGSPLPPVALQYADFVIWQKRNSEERIVERDLAYWRDRLERMPTVLTLPTDRARPLVRTSNGGSYRGPFDVQMLRDLKQSARREEVTLFTLLLAALKLTLARRTGSSAVVVGTVVAGRTHHATEDTIGCFINSIAIATDLAPPLSTREVLRRVGESVSGAFEHSETPFEKVVEAVRPPRVPGCPPVFQVAFGVREAVIACASGGGVTFAAREMDREEARFDLTVWVEEDQGALTALWTFSADLFNGQSIERLHSEFTSMIRKMLDELRRGESPAPPCVVIEERGGP
jgi:amino acid adenylation domain-containing protein